MLAFRYPLFGWLVGDWSVQIMIRDVPFYGISLDVSLAPKEEIKKTQATSNFNRNGILTILPISM